MGKKQRKKTFLFNNFTIIGVLLRFRLANTNFIHAYSTALKGYTLKHHVRSNIKNGRR